MALLDDLIAAINRFLADLFRLGVGPAPDPDTPPGPGPLPSGPGATPDPFTVPDLIHKPPDSIRRALDLAAGRYGIPYRVLAKIAFVESSFRPEARNDSDRPPSVGLMGIKSSTARSLMSKHDSAWRAYTVPEIEKRLHDPMINADVGARLLLDISKTRKEARNDEIVLISMYHLGETRYLSGERDAAYVDRYRKA